MLGFTYRSLTKGNESRDSVVGAHVYRISDVGMKQKRGVVEWYKTESNS
jgi:hypothetical protein